VKKIDKDSIIVLGNEKRNESLVKPSSRTFSRRISMMAVVIALVFSTAIRLWKKSLRPVLLNLSTKSHQEFIN